MRKNIVLTMALPLLLSFCTRVYDGSEATFFDPSNAQQDVIRIPIKYPFQLISAFDKNSFSMDYPMENFFGINLKIDSICLIDELFVCHFSNFMREEEYGLFSFSDSSVALFNTKPQYNKGTTFKLYHVSDAFDFWIKNKRLPWQPDRQKSQEQGK